MGAPTKQGRPEHWYLVTVYVRLAKAGRRHDLTNADLDQIADILFATDNVATVRIEPVSIESVYRLDLLATTPEEAAAGARGPLDELERQLGIQAEVTAVVVQ